MAERLDEAFPEWLYLRAMRPPFVQSTDRLDPQGSSALSAPEHRGAHGYVCDVCDERFEGRPAGAGLFIWSRGDEVRYEEPPLCEECAAKVSIGALFTFACDEDEEG